MREYLNLRTNIALGLIFAFLMNTLGPLPAAQADEFRLPAPGVMVSLSPEFNPPILKGIKVNPDNPFRFDFILDQGDLYRGHVPREAGHVSPQEQLKQESTRLIKYFLASLTIPEKDLWVNLSPYEKDRIIPSSFGLTEMGRDLLAEDYMLKQITASLVYPEDGTGRKFWKRVYEEAFKKFGTTDIPVNTFNKVWIVPDKAVVYENAKAGTAYVVEAKLKVMLEQDYLSLQKHSPVSPLAYRNDMASVGANIVREIVIPQLDIEVNTGKSFSQLRQVYNSLILAAWYKKKIKDSILAQVYEDKKKIAGVGYKNYLNVDNIYQRYLQAFKKGAYNYIKEEQDPITQQMVTRKYFSGGMSLINLAMTTVVDGSRIANGRTAEITVNLVGLVNRNPGLVLSQQDRGFLNTIDGLTVGGKYKFQYTGRKSGGESPDGGASDVFIINGTKRVKGAGPDASYLTISPLNRKGYIEDGRVKLVVESFRLKYEEDQRKGILRAFLDRLPIGTIYKSESIINVPTVLHMLNEILKQPLFIETVSPEELEVIRSFISTLMSNPDIYNVKLFEPACHFMDEYKQKAQAMHLKSLDDIFIESPVGQGLEKSGLHLQRVGFETRWKYFSMYAINIKDQAMLNPLNVDTLLMDSRKAPFWEMSRKDEDKIRAWIQSGQVLPEQKWLLRKLFVFILYEYSLEPSSGIHSKWLKVLQQQWHLSTTKQLTNLLRWFARYSIYIERVSVDVFYDFMNAYVESYSKFPGWRDNFNYIVKSNLHDNTKIQLVAQNMKRMTSMFPAEMIQRKGVLKAPIEGTDYYIGLEYGLLESTHGLYLVLGEDKKGQVPLREEVIFKVGLDTQGDTFRIIMLQGGTEKQKEINEEIPAKFGMLPAIALMYSVLQLASDGKVKIRNKPEFNPPRETFHRLLGIRRRYMPAIINGSSQMNINANYSRFGLRREDEDFGYWQDIEHLMQVTVPGRLKQSDLQAGTIHKMMAAVENFEFIPEKSFNSEYNRSEELPENRAMIATQAPSLVWTDTRSREIGLNDPYEKTPIGRGQNKFEIRIRGRVFEIEKIVAQGGRIYLDFYLNINGSPRKIGYVYTNHVAGRQNVIAGMELSSKFQGNKIGRFMVRMMLDMIPDIRFTDISVRNAVLLRILMNDFGFTPVSDDAEPIASAYYIEGDLRRPDVVQTLGTIPEDKRVVISNADYDKFKIAEQTPEIQAQYLRTDKPLAALAKMPGVTPIYLRHELKRDPAMIAAEARAAESIDKITETAEDYYDFSKKEDNVRKLEEVLREVMQPISSRVRPVVVGGRRYLGPGRKDVDVLLEGTNERQSLLWKDYVQALANRLNEVDGIQTRMLKDGPYLLFGVVAMEAMEVVFVSRSGQRAEITLDILLDYSRSDIVSDKRIKALLQLDDKKILEAPLADLAKSYFRSEYYIGDEKVYHAMRERYRAGEASALDQPIRQRLLELKTLLLEMRDEEIKYRIQQRLSRSAADWAMSNLHRSTGGIDLRPAVMNVQTQNSHGEIKFHMDPAMLQQLQNAPGFVPVIVNIRTITDLRMFLGIDTLR